MSGQLDEKDEEWVQQMECTLVSGGEVNDVKDEDDAEGSQSSPKIGDLSESSHADREDALLTSITDGMLEGFVLPAKPSDLTVDPRSGIKIVEVPENLRATIGMVSRKGDRFPPPITGEPIIHWIGVVGKMNHGDSKFEERVMAVTNLSVFLLYKDGDIARCIEVKDVSSIVTVKPDIVGICSKAEGFDLVVRADNMCEAIVPILSRLVFVKTNADLIIEECDKLDALKKKVQLKKPGKWVLKSGYVHTKAELYQHLKLILTRPQDKEHPQNVDPRTGAEFVNLPKNIVPLVSRQPYYPKSGEPIIHFFAPVIKINHKLGRDKRFILLGNSHIYMLYINGTLQRCMYIPQITEIAAGEYYVGLKIKSEFDIIIRFARVQAGMASRLAGLIKNISEYRNSVPIKIDRDPDALSGFNLVKPKSFQHVASPLLTRGALQTHLRRLGYQFSAQPAVSKEEKVDVKPDEDE